MKTNLLIILSVCLFITEKGNAQDTIIAKKKYFTQRLSGTITLDGIPKEEICRPKPKCELCLMRPVCFYYNTVIKKSR